MDDLIIVKALDFVNERMRHRCRDTAPAPHHPVAEVLVIASTAGPVDREVLAAAVLDRILAQTETSADEIEQHFGPRVRSLVQELAESPGQLSKDAAIIAAADKTTVIQKLLFDEKDGMSAADAEKYLAEAEGTVRSLPELPPQLLELFWKTAAEARRRIVELRNQRAR